MPEIFTTNDGSHSLISDEFGVSYHSRHGAITETQTVFVDAGLLHKAAILKEISVLEIGEFVGRKDIEVSCEFKVSDNQYKSVYITFKSPKADIKCKVEYDGSIVKSFLNDSLVSEINNASNVLLEGPNPLFDIMNASIMKNSKKQESKVILISPSLSMMFFLMRL